jgi:hypothetical protein
MNSAVASPTRHRHRVRVGRPAALPLTAECQWQ